MKNKSILMAMLLGGMISLQACKNDDDLISIDKETFMAEATSGNILEIQTGSLAVQQAEKPAVKAYAGHMIMDHSMVMVKLDSVSKAQNITLSMQLNGNHQQQLNSLIPLNGNAFDKAYASLMVQSHQNQVNLFEQAAEGVNDLSLRGFAAKSLPTLRTHLQEAIALNATVNP